MTILNVISELWKEEKLPVIRGLVKSDCAFYEFDTDELRLLKSTDFYVGNYRNEFSYVNITVSLKHLDVNYYCGDGSHGSDGWALATNSDNSIKWLFFDYVNPFEKMWIENDEIHIMSNLKTEWIFPIDKPEHLYCIKHEF